ncbi:MAG: efflux RND transporter periplasmic adaptor subunit [Prevotella sp.]|nr:efflux RND transporter periplasmic adaptor subunit [Candidatus Equicola faecalis]
MKKIFFVALAVLTLASCGSKDKDVKMQVTPQVKLAKVERIPVEQNETYTATVESDVKNNISPNTPRRIKKIYVDVGDVVRAGQTVALLDVASEDQLNIQLQSQMSAVESQKAQVQLAQSEYNRIEELYKIGGVSKSDFESAQTQLTIQKLLLKQQQNQINTLKSQINQTSQNTRLVAPISGVVTARNYDDGDMYASLPILTVEQLNPIKMKVNVSESYFSLLKNGMSASIDLDAYQGEVFSGKVTTIYPAIDQATHTFVVEITITNHDNKVRPGMFGRARLALGVEERCVIPDAALVKQVGAGDRYVYVYKDGKVTYQKIELGKHLGDKYEILNGVKDGDQVVIAGQARLANGREVEVVK